MALKFTSSRLNFNKFYRLRDPLATGPLRLSPNSEISSALAISLTKGQHKIDKPLQLGGYQGGGIRDFLWTDFPPLVCVSTRVVDLLKYAQYTGWSTYPVDISDRIGQKLTEYHGLVVTGPECRRERSRSKIVEKPPPSRKGRGYKVYKGLYFDETCWEGSDFFWIQNSGIVITDRVYRLFKKETVTNIKMIALPEVEIKVSLDRYDKDI